MKLPSAPTFILSDFRKRLDFQVAVYVCAAVVVLFVVILIGCAALMQQKEYTVINGQGVGLAEKDAFVRNIKEQIDMRRPLVFSSLCLIIFSVLAFLFFARWIHDALMVPIRKMINDSMSEDAIWRLGNLTSSCDELNRLRNLLIKMRSRLDEEARKNLDMERRILMGEISSQVAHDIRSPLTALSMLVRSVPELDEEKRNLLKNAVTRIEDITNTLNSRDSKIIRGPKYRLRSEPLAGHIDTLVSEKRSEFAGRDLISIQFELQPDYLDFFAKVVVGDFKRVLSNIINNSVEALRPGLKGIVKVTMTRNSQVIVIEISDNGKGIPDHIKDRVFNQSFSYGKPSGSGLGLYHANQTLTSWNGSISLSDSHFGGARVELRLPVSESPKWLATRLDLSGKKNVIIADDMQSIHDVWKSRLSSYCIAHFYNLGELESFLSRVDAREWACLIDYDFIGGKESGLDLIERSELENVYLVTSHFDDIEIQNRCIEKRIKIIPKTMVPLVPIINGDLRDVSANRRHLQLKEYREDLRSM